VTTRRPPRDILRRDRAVLVVFVVRQASSVAVLVWLTLALFQLDDHRIAWTMAVADRAAISHGLSACADHLT